MNTMAKRFNNHIPPHRRLFTRKPYWPDIVMYCMVIAALIAAGFGVFA
jgi:hypothetical protein